ncbi:MAG: hypothetical protein M1834_003613 [Cirrosporium novae-zelandiae]|nr:MAG: hypothetical protein M1834_003613 [Cirrosporium novae-zelandiae]
MAMASGMIPSHLSQSTALRVAQQAPLLLKTQESIFANLSLPLLSTPETSELWLSYENLLLACLRTGDDRSAHLCLQKLTKRFGATNEHVMGLRGIYQEAIAENQSALLEVLKEYEQTLSENPVNMPVAKRRIALLRSLSRPADAIAALVKLLDASPTDAEAWCELSDLYVSQGFMAQAIFSIEEALLIVPNAWNIHARLGELKFLSANARDLEPLETRESLYNEAIRRFCRSIELCDDYIRGYYGLKLLGLQAASSLLEIKPPNGKKSPASETRAEDELPLMSKETVIKLNELATSKLKQIIQETASRGKLGEKAKAEIIAAQELLDRDSEAAK